MALDVIGACPALFPCEDALPARNRLGVAQDTCLKSRARWLEQGCESQQQQKHKCWPGVVGGV